MAKSFHSELCQLQNTLYSAKAAAKVFRDIGRGKHPKRPSGQPLSGVDITYLAAFRSRHNAR